MRLPAFAYEVPQSIDEALKLLSQNGPNCRILAGGTDLLVRMKQRLVTPTHVISLKALPELTHIQESEGMFHIGAGARLSDILDHPGIQESLPGLYEAVKSIGAPSIQHFAGTIGGNLCQDNRCQFYNQSSFFRQARQPCNKAGGKTCYAWEGGSDKCYSICASDAAPVLIAMDAEVVIRSAAGERIIPLESLYSSVGERPLTLTDDEMLTEIRVAGQTPGTGNAFEKLTYRSAIDYAVVSAGASVQREGERITRARLSIGAVARAPLAIPTVEAILQGKPAGDEEAFYEAGKAAMNTAQPFIANNMSQPIDYRTRMVSVMAKRAIRKALSRTGLVEAQ